MAIVLVIEDDSESARLIADALRQRGDGFEVVVAGCARAGLRILADRQVDCVVLDYKLPDVDGLECLNAIRGSHPELPVIVNTAEGSEEVAANAIKLGADEYVVKRRTYLARLCQLVHDVIARRELERANSRISRGIFVGRRGELAQIRAAIDDAGAGRGRIVLLAGEAGIGKTSLAQEAARYARQRGVRTLCGRCHETGDAPPYWPWTSVVRDYLRGTGRAADEVGDEGCGLDLATADGLESNRELFGRCTDVTGFLQRASHRQPLMVLLGDLHWADDPSIHLLRFVAREIADCRVLVVGSYRESEVVNGHALAQALVELRREPPFEQLRLRGLSEEEVRALVGAIAQRDVSADFARAIHQRTEGNPLFVQEILRHLADEGHVYHDGDQWRCDVSADELPVPESVREVIRRRVGHLPAFARDVLGAAAAIGREFSRDTLLHAVELPEAQVLEALREAVRTRVLSEQPGAERAYRFSHSLIHETLSEDISPTARAALRRRLHVSGDACSARRDDPPATAGESLFRLEGEFWTIGHDGHVVRLRDTKGLHYVAQLLRHPGQDLLAMELMAAASRPGVAPILLVDDDAGDSLVDAPALADFRRQRILLQELIEEARSNNDLGQLAACIEQDERLADHLSSSVGLGGRPRRMTSNAERARQAVTKGIWNAVTRIGQALPALRQHLTDHIRTGYLCSYRPDPDHRIVWQF